MKNLLLILVILNITLCCSPKYTASFQNYDRSQGATSQTIETQIGLTEVTQTLPFAKEGHNEVALASVDNQPADVSISRTKINATELRSVSKKEKKTLINQIRSEIKTSLQEPKTEKKGNPQLNFFAISSSFLFVGGVLLSAGAPGFLILSLVGVIFGIIGLWSQRKAWAIAALAIFVASIILVMVAFSSFE